MRQPTTDQTLYTPEEYLALERAAVEKSEYINGHIYPMQESEYVNRRTRAMAGASRRHNLIAGNLFGELHEQLKERPCEVYVSDMRVKVDPGGMYTYPDVTVVCGRPQFEDTQIDTLVNPTLIIEVLSPSTEAYDRGEKFAHYRGLVSLRDYLLVAQDRVHVEHYARQGEQWVLSEIDDPAAILLLPSTDCVLPLSEVYDKVEFPDPLSF